MPRRPPPERPIGAVPRVLLTRTEAAASCGVSESFFRSEIEPHLKVVILKSLVQVPVGEIEEYAKREARHVA